MTCHNCNDAQMVKFGVRNGIQRYRCRVCKVTSSDSPENPLGELRVPFEKAVQVVNLLCESTGIRACERLTGLNRRTILNVLSLAGQRAALYLDNNVRNIKAEIVQADEIHTMVFYREQNNIHKFEDWGAQFMFLAVDRHSKLIINHLVGKRTSENAQHFMADLRLRVHGKFQLVTDNPPSRTPTSYPLRPEMETISATFIHSATWVMLR